MRRLAVIPCGKKKIWDVNPSLGPTKVEDAYIGNLHKLTREYAELFCDEWVILSGKYGYCSPDEIIKGNYDITFGMKETEAQISFEKLKKQIKEKQLTVYDQIVVLTGKKHKKVVESTFDGKVSLVFPLLGTKGIGEMQQRLKKAILAKQPIKQG
ncbi:DUF6884 domain-containing protein [Amphibacillus cookii]|uniref:DUF6884 domain-containing protein n=1 Tax=Amphibacillus cookii TaxID=767787 RepID=UPI001959FCCD|nr:DUF6884 domain-containing protein [Amphibacillus cookii]MBM7540396.1 hypothetical protein [Amphibacillus cookii]